MRRTVIVGPGRVGRVLALVHQRGGDAVTLLGRRRGRWQRGAKAAGLASGVFPDDLPEAPGLVLLAVPDRAVRAVADQLAGALARRPRALVAHLSGLHDLKPLRKCGARGHALAAIHPILPFAAPEDALAALPEATTTILAGPGARSAARRVVEGWPARPLLLPAGVDRRRYHLALSLAANHVTALLGWAEELLEPALGKRAREVAGGLAAAAVAASLRSGPEAALTGPVVRGDVEVLELHLRSLRGKERARYRAALEPVLRLAERSGRLEKKPANEVRKLL